MKKIKNESDLDTLYRSVRAYSVIGAWVEQGLFQLLSEADMVPLESVGMNRRSLEIMAPILSHLGLLRVTSSHIGMTKTAKELWESGALRLPPLERSIGVLPQTSDILLDGGPAKSANGASLVSEGGVREEDLEDTRNFMEMLYRRSEDSAEALASFIHERVPEGSHVLDLGGGHGRYGEALVARGFSVSLYDRPVCVDLARERYGDSLAYIEGDFLTSPLEGAFDCVFLSNIVHGLGPDELCGLFRSIRGCLRPGGVMVVKDMFIDSHYANPENAVFFGMTMLFYTREGRSYTIPHFHELLVKSGFQPQEHQFDMDGGFSFILCDMT